VSDVVDQLITWAVRAIHVFGAAVWIGGYAVMLLAIVPYLARERSEAVRGLALTTARVISFAGALTVVAGLLMIWRSRGYGFLFVGEWGGIVVTSFVLALVMGAVGDAGLRPAIRRLDPDRPEGVKAVRRWAIAGLTLGVLALLLMTRAIYART
jgi:putative copper export protein